VLIFVAIDLVTALLLLGAFTLIWREKKNHRSIRAALPAVALLAAGRVCDVLLEHPGLRKLPPFGMTPATYEVIVAAAGNLADVLGVLFLVVGFRAIVTFQEKTNQFISQLETFLPICSYCKKYRTEDDEWLPIEKYLKESTGRKLTHGICPECNARIREEFLRKRRL